MVVYPVSDLGPLLTFYSEGLGLPIALQDGDRFATLGESSPRFALAGPEEAVAGYLPTAAFRVDDLDATIERLVAMGAAVVRRAVDGGHERRSVLRDPAGHLFVLYA